MFLKLLSSFSGVAVHVREHVQPCCLFTVSGIPHVPALSIKIFIKPDGHFSSTSITAQVINFLTARRSLHGSFAVVHTPFLSQSFHSSFSVSLRLDSFFSSSRPSTSLTTSLSLRRWSVLPSLVTDVALACSKGGRWPTTSAYFRETRRRRGMHRNVLDLVAKRDTSSASITRQVTTSSPVEAGKVRFEVHHQHLHADLPCRQKKNMFG